MSANVEVLFRVAQLMRENPDRRWHAVADWLDREARRSNSHAMTTHKVRDDWYSFQCLTCGTGGSASRAGMVDWQAAHGRLQLLPDDAALAVAHAYLGGAR